MTKLSDMQLILLSTAASRGEGSLLPPAPSLGTRGDRIRRSVEALLKRELAAEMPVQDKGRSWRDDEGRLYGVAITEAGRVAIGVDVEPKAEPKTSTAREQTQQPEPQPAPVTAMSPRPESKLASVLVLLQRPEGATLPELIASTSWLPHTTRAALTGLRKKGHVIAKGKGDGATCYSLPVAN